MAGEARIPGIWPRTIWPNILVYSLSSFHPTTATLTFFLFFIFAVFVYQQNPKPLPWIPFLQLGPRSASPTYSDLANEPLCKQVMSWNPKHRRFLCLISKPLLRGYTRSCLFCAPIMHRVTQKQQDSRNERLPLPRDFLLYCSLADSVTWGRRPEIELKLLENWH